MIELDLKLAPSTDWRTMSPDEALTPTHQESNP